MVERLISNQDVRGSNPRGSTKITVDLCWLIQYKPDAIIEYSTMSKKPKHEDECEDDDDKKGHHGHHEHDDDHDDNHCVPCFMSGSQVVTTRGYVPVDEIQPGMRVLTADNGYRDVAWVGKTLATAEWVDLGYTRVSANHRMLVQNSGPERFISAKRLIRSGTPGVLVKSRVEFVHFMFDQHEVVNVDDIWSESFYPGDWIMRNMNPEQVTEIYTLFPELDTSIYQLARPEVKQLVF